MNVIGRRLARSFGRGRAHPAHSGPADVASVAEEGSRLRAEHAATEQWIAVDRSGVVRAADSGGLVSRLGIEAGAQLWSQVRGLSPQLQDLLLNGRLHPGRRRVLLAVPAEKEDWIDLELRVLAAGEDEIEIAISDRGRPGPSGEAQVQDRLDLVARSLALCCGEADLKEAVRETLRSLCERLGFEAAAFYVLREYPFARFFTAYGKTRRRGVPYPHIDCGQELLAPLVQGAPLVALSVPPAELPQGLADVCVRDPQEVLLSAASTDAGLVGLLVLSTVMQRRPDAGELCGLRLVSQLLGLMAQRELRSAESEQSSAVLETAYAVSRTISRSLDVQDTFEIVAKNAARLVRGTRCLLFELADDGELVSVASSHHDIDLTGVSLRLDDPAMDEMMRQRHLHIAVEELVWSAPVPSALRRALEVRTALFLPMLAHGQLIGSLVLISERRNRPLSTRDIELAEEVADQAAVAIYNARLYHDLSGSRRHVQELMRRMARIRDTERRDLASIVHDDVIQTVVGCVYKLEAARDDLPDEVQPSLTDAIAQLQGAIHEAREVISDLRPPALEGLGLEASLRTLVQRMDGQGPASVRLEIVKLPELTPAKSTALYRIAREALVNAQRHAEAHRVIVRIDVDDAAEAGVLRLSVQDDGRGRSGGGLETPGHFGIQMMEEQAALAGGTLTVSSGAASGLLVQALIPLEEDAP